MIKKNNRKCNRCFLPDNRYGAVLDKNRQCNYCNYYEAHSDEMTDYKRLQQLFVDRINRIKGKYQYDAYVGLSGGKDSTYMVYKLLKDYGLKVCVTTWDNGFLSDDARINAENVANILINKFPGQITYRYGVLDKDIGQILFRNAFSRLADPCVVCFMSIFSVLYCHRNSIPYKMHGRTPYQLYRHYDAGSIDKFSSLININLKEYSADRLLDFYNRIDADIRRFLRVLLRDKEEREKVYRHLYVDPKTMDKDFVPEILNFFIYHEYDELRIRDVLDRELGYKALATHADCRISPLGHYLTKNINAIRTGDLSSEEAALIRMGNKKEAERLKKDRLDEKYPSESIKIFCRKLNVNICYFWFTVYKIILVKSVIRLIPMSFRKKLYKYFLY